LGDAFKIVAAVLARCGKTAKSKTLAGTSFNLKIDLLNSRNKFSSSNGAKNLGKNSESLSVMNLRT